MNANDPVRELAIKACRSLLASHRATQRRRGVARRCDLCGRADETHLDWCAVGIAIEAIARDEENRRNHER